VTLPLEDMTPFLPREELAAELEVPFSPGSKYVGSTPVMKK
jgi:hypothetical protein